MVYLPLRASQRCRRKLEPFRRGLVSGSTNNPCSFIISSTSSSRSLPKAGSPAVVPVPLKGFQDPVRSTTVLGKYCPPGLKGPGGFVQASSERSDAEIKCTGPAGQKQREFQGEETCLRERLCEQDRYVQKCRGIKNPHDCRVFIDKCVCDHCRNGSEPQVLPPPNFQPAFDLTRCEAAPFLTARLRDCQVFLREDLGLKPVRLPDLSRLQCGTLRTTLRGCYGELTPLEELSVKTSQKIEERFCDYCADRFDGLVTTWVEERFRPVEVDDDHVELFARQFARNVDEGWNRGSHPYVPNGHAALGVSRRQGGNWNKGEFEDWCEPKLVISSGKPRVITCFSEHNTRVLTPLHLSLYDLLKKKSWVLVGDPGENHVNALNGDGEFVSLDYRAATDSFKTAYVRAAIEVLISKAVGLDDDQVRCLRVLGELRLERGGEVATVGQPMGSVMSFPLLCLFNKTVQDLAMNDLLQERKIGFREWTQHRCLINGDDGLTRNPRQKIDMKARIGIHSAKVGMCVNAEKTMVDRCRAEINSTLFSSLVEAPSQPGSFDSFLPESRIKKRIKSNCSAVFAKPKVQDILGFACDSTSTVRGFVHVVLKNRRVLAKQRDKWLDRVPGPHRRALLREPRIVKALKSSPAAIEDCPTGYLAMSQTPEGFDMSRREVVETINSEVEKIRDQHGADRPFSARKNSTFKTVAIPMSGSFAQVLRPRRSPSPALSLKCVNDAFQAKKWKILFDNTRTSCSDMYDDICFGDLVPPGTSKINELIAGCKARQAPSLPNVILSNVNRAVGLSQLRQDFIAFED